VEINSDTNPIAHRNLLAEQVDSMIKENSLNNTSFGVQLVSNSTDGRNTQLI